MSESDNDNDSSLSSTDEPKSPKLPSNIGKHIYFNDDDEEKEDEPKSPKQKIIERPMPPTIRVDGSDLISRCKDFIPLLSDPNQKNPLLENDDDDEFNIPDILSDKSSKESGEASSTNDDADEKSTEIDNKKKRKKKKKKKKKKLKINDDLNQDVKVEN